MIYFRRQNVIVLATPWVDVLLGMYLPRRTMYGAENRPSFFAPLAGCINARPTSFTIRNVDREKKKCVSLTLAA